MATPESLRDPIKENNGHHDYSESISNFLSDLDDLDDLDLSGIFNSSPSSVEEDLAAEDFVMNDLIAEKPVADDLVAEERPVDAEVVSEFKSIEPEAKQDQDSSSFGIDSTIFDAESLKNESKSIPVDYIEPISAETKTEEVLEIHSPEIDTINVEADAIWSETALGVEPIAHEATATHVESPEVNTKEETIHDPLEANLAETELHPVLETSDLQTEFVAFDVEEVNAEEIEVGEVESESTPIAFESESTASESTAIEPAQTIAAPDLEAELAPAALEESKAEAEPIHHETEALPALEANSFEPAAFFALAEIKNQVSSIKTESDFPQKAAQLSEPIKVKSESAPVMDEPVKIKAGPPSVLQTDLVVSKKSDLAIEEEADGPWFKRLNLRVKATLLALSLGTLPVVATGTLAYFSTSPAVQEAAIAKQEARVSQASTLASQFIFARYGDIQILSNLPIFTNPKGTASITGAQKQAILDKYIKIYGVYDSIALLDLNGDAIVHSTGKQLPNYKDREYFQAVLKTQKPFISQPEASKVTGELSMFFAAPVFDVETGKMISIVRSRMPVRYLSNIVEGEGHEVFLIDNNENYFVAGKKEEVGLKAEKDFTIFPRLHKDKKTATEIYFNPKERIEELVTYSPGAHLEGLPDLNWSVLVASETKEAFAALSNLRLALIAGTTVAALLVGAIAVFLANRATRPIIESAEAVRKIGQGELDIRVHVSGQDEMADLGNNINAMAVQLQTFLTQQEEETRERQLFTEISQAREPQSLEAPLNTLLSEVRATLQLDRAVVYRFYPDWSGHIVGESVLPGWPVALADKIEDACIPQELLDAYKKGRVVPTSDVFNAGFHPDHLELMTRLQIKANLVVPILQGEELFGILVAHHCAKTHDWQQSEIEYLQATASKMGAPLGGLGLFERKEYEAEQERNRNQGLQMELMNLLGDVQGASDGDLTVRADVSAGEIGIVADFFNSIVESLRDIVSQVKDASAQVNTSVGSNEVVMGQLADDAQVQAQQVTNTLKSVEQMALSIQEVAENARKASKVAGLASTTAESGGKTMDRTVDSILMLRETVAETSKKVKRLGESSQQISKAVSLINQIALQTNLLAINASIEAARAGKEGRGFAVVAEEVGALAAQSAEATKEIEQIVENIQSETGEVVDAMERGTTQVVEGTRQVEEAKESLQQIVKVSRQIDELLQSISSATVSQTEASEVVKQLMQQVTQSSERTSDTSRQVSGSLQETVAIAQRLQASVGTFKVEN